MGRTWHHWLWKIKVGNFFALLSNLSDHSNVFQMWRYPYGCKWVPYYPKVCMDAAGIIIKKLMQWFEFREPVPIHMPILKLVMDCLRTAEITLDVLPIALWQPYCEKSGTQVGTEAIKRLVVEEVVINRTGLPWLSMWSLNRGRPEDEAKLRAHNKPYQKPKCVLIERQYKTSWTRLV